MAFYLALDAGGTKTEYVLANDTHELARVRGGTIKRMRTDADTAARNFADALAELTHKTGIAMTSITRSCVGTAGITVPLVSDWIREAFARSVSGTLILVGDVEIALDAAFFGGPGVLVMAGTGSNVAGRTRAGQLTTAGGWGPALADQGSGNRIGHQALREAFLALDENRPSTLMPAILHLWQLPDAHALVAYGNQIPPPDFTRLTPLVVECAQGGDTAAQNVLRREAEDLAHLGRLVIDRLVNDRLVNDRLVTDQQPTNQQATGHQLNDRLDHAEANAQPQAETPAKTQDTTPNWLPSLAFTGSILEHIPPVRAALVEALHRDLPTLHILPGVVDPILGALWRARNGEPSLTPHLNTPGAQANP
ncbi:MAG: ATPase [Acidobacteriota bacterium]|nr:ATPase [Acidobacteriota bacterium]